MTAILESRGSLLRRPAEPLLTATSPLGPLSISAVDVGGSPLRSRMEEFVRRGYRERFGAEVETFLPRLLGAADGSGALRAVLGFRSGGAEPLFLEQYLDEPIEAALTRAADQWRVAGQCVQRSQVLEVGNLVADPTSVAPAFFQAFLVWVTSTTRCDWLVFTGTRSVRALLGRLGAELLEIAVARPERLREAPEQWGAYYRHQPCVVAASLSNLLTLLDPALFDPAQLRSWIEHGLQVRR